MNIFCVEFAQILSTFPIACSTIPSPDWLVVDALSCDRANLLLTSMPGMRVLDAHVHIGCHHLTFHR
jgi:hypothetical protein